MKILPLTRLAIIGLSLYYSGNKKQPPWLQSSVIMTSLIGALDSIDELLR